MLNRLLGQKLLRVLFRLQPPKRRVHDAVEQEGEVDEQCEAHDLQPLERLPPKPQRDDPDEECAARVDCGARRRTDGAGYGEAEEVEAAAGLLACCRR